MVNFSPLLGIATTVAEVNHPLSSRNARSYLSFHSNLISFFVRLVKGATILEKPCPRKIWIYEALLGLVQFCTAFVFVESIEIPSCETTWPRNFTSFKQNSHLLNFAYRQFSRRVGSAICKCITCSSSVLE